MTARCLNIEFCNMLPPGPRCISIMSCPSCFAISLCVHSWRSGSYTDPTTKHSLWPLRGRCCQLSSLRRLRGGYQTTRLLERWPTKTFSGIGRASAQLVTSLTVAPAAFLASCLLSWLFMSKGPTRRPACRFHVVWWFQFNVHLHGL